MLKKICGVTAILSTLVVAGSAQGPKKVALGDWPDARGPNRDGTSKETGLPDKWTLNGQNMNNRNQLFAFASGGGTK